MTLANNECKKCYSHNMYKKCLVHTTRLTKEHLTLINYINCCKCANVPSVRVEDGKCANVPSVRVEDG